MSRKNKNSNTNTSLILIDKPCQFTYSIRLEALLLDLADNISFAIVGSHLSNNNYGFRLLDMSDRKGYFRIFTESKKVDYITTQEFIDKLSSYMQGNHYLNQPVNLGPFEVPTPVDTEDYDT